MSLVAPFPYFGGKRRVASVVWKAFGDPGGYVEPFAGSAAVLLARPSFTNSRVETLNDADGWLVNAWRSIQLSPDAVARHSEGPVTEIDYHARLAWLQVRRDADLVSWLEGNPEHHDAKAAAWWLYVCACGIGDPWSPGPWHIVEGHLRKTSTDAQGIACQLPHLSDGGQGIRRKIPHLGDGGKGVYSEIMSKSTIYKYMNLLSDRLREVRIVCGDWKRVLTPSVVRAKRGGDGVVAVFLDPPYSTSGNLYGHIDENVSIAVKQWCLQATTELRIILCGYDNDHAALLHHGWVKENGAAGSGSGYSVDPLAGKRERLWLSPSCLRTQMELKLLP